MAESPPLLMMTARQLSSSPLQLRNIFLSGIISVLGTFPLFAGITVEIYFDNGNIADGTVAALVADANQDGFLDLDDPTVPGTTIEAGETIGLSDDVIIAVVSADAGDHWANGAGIAETFERIDYEDLRISEGTPLILYLFPELAQAGDPVQESDNVIRYRNSAVGGSGGDIPFQAPADSGVYVLSTLVAASGGDFDPGNPGGGETYDNASVGGEDHGDTRNTATNLTSANLAVPGELEPGDIDYFALGVSGPTRVVFYTTGGTSMVGELFSPEGSPLNNAIADGDKGDGTNFRIEYILPAGGTCYLAVTGDGDNQTGTYDLFYEAVPYVANRPDATIGKTFSSQRGNDFYTRSGAGQKHRQVTSRKKFLTYRFTTQNDGEEANSIGGRGANGNRYFKANYFQVTAGRQNVTAAFINNGIQLQLNSREQERFELKVKPKSRAMRSSKRMKRTFLISARSTGLMDRVRAEAVKE